MKIGVDLDEVLAQFLPALIKYHNEKYKTEFTLGQFRSYLYHETWGGTLEEAIKKVGDFHESDYVSKIKPVSGSQDAIRNLSNKHDLYVITSRHIKHKEETLLWLKEHFPKSFKGVHFSSHLSKNYDDKQKSHICDELEIDIMIEDGLGFATECHHPDRHVFLLDYPWNQHHTLPEGIERVYSWGEIELLI